MGIENFPFTFSSTENLLDFESTFSIFSFSFSYEVKANSIGWIKIM